MTMKQALFLITSFALSATASETKIKMEDLPAPVQAAVKQQSQGATIKGFAKEIENGKTTYEAQLTIDGHAKDVSFDSAAKVVSIEEETPLEKIPAAARDAIRKSIAGGTLKMVETVTESGKTFYEASFKTQAGKNKELRFDADGKSVK